MTEKTYTFRQGDLPRLDLQVDRGTEFTAWCLQWESYSCLSGLAKEAGTQVKALMLSFSRDTLAIVQNLGLTEDQMKAPQDIIAAIRAYVDGHVNETVERRNFRRRRQQAGESFDDFLIALRELIKTCKFCSDAWAQKGLRDQIIEGLQNADTVEDLLKEKDLTLATTIMRFRSREAAKKHCSDITEVEPGTIAAARTPYQARSKTCTGCGGPWHKVGRQQCPAYNQLCIHCHKVGHFSKVCRSRQTQQPLPLAKPGANAIHTDHQHAVQLFPLTQQLTDPAPKIRVQVSTVMGTHELTVLPDSGADISAAGTDILTCLGCHPNNLLPSAVIPKSVDGHNMTPLGCIPVTFCLQQQQYHDNLHFLPGVTGAIISWKAAKGLGILPYHYPSPAPNKSAAVQTTTAWSGSAKMAAAEEIMEEYPTVFDGQVRVMEGEQFHIRLQEDAAPFCVKTPRVVPFAYRDKLKEELDLLQQQGIITPVTEATRWCAPIVVTPKKGTECVRMCVDLSKLNKFVVRERYMSPIPAEAVADIAAQEAKYFTVIDAAKGYHQCPLTSESQELTTFITPYGRFAGSVWALVNCRAL